jgi:hypothetical protein
MSALEKSHLPSTQISGSMLLGERILILLFFCFSSYFLSDFLVYSDGNVVELLEGEEEDDSAALVTRRCVVEVPIHVFCNDLTSF